MALVEEVYENTQISDPNKLLPYVCDELTTRFADDSLEYHLSQMHLETTDDVLRTISCFFVSKQLFPTKSYIKDSKKGGK